MEEDGHYTGKEINMERLVVLCERNIEAERLSYETQKYLILQSNEQTIARRYEEYAKVMYAELRTILTEGLKQPVLIQLIGCFEGEQKVYRGLAAMLKTANLENPNLYFQVIEFERQIEFSNISKYIDEEAKQPECREIRYIDGNRYVKTYEEGMIECEETRRTLPWKERGVYLITGGMGGLGLLFAREIIQQVKEVTLILTGRRRLDENIEKQIEALTTKGVEVCYRTVDIADENQVKKLIEEIRNSYHILNGILHCAGVTKDNYIIHKSEDEFQAVLEPKVAGLNNLDQCTADMNIDFMVLFSSESGENGNAGQADYATANAFMDAFAEYRTQLVEKGKRYGRTISVNWPLWEQGGMHVSQEVENSLLETRGMIPLETQVGIQTFYQVLEKDCPQVMVMEGNIEIIRKEQMEKVEHVRNASLLLETEDSKFLEEDELKEKTIRYLKKILSTAIKLPVSRIEEEEPMENYGIDSIMILQMTLELEKVFGKLPKTLFFEYQTIEQLSHYFLESYREVLRKTLKRPVTYAKDVPDKKQEEILPVKKESYQFKKQNVSKDKIIKNGSMEREEPIAIIGIAGKYPEAENLDKFWNNLCVGKDCVIEIPEERWDYHLYFDEDRTKKGKTYSKWGGFIKDYDKFDPLFFNISPHEAELIDPQERLFLECVYETLEDAGYTKESLKQYKGTGMEENVGVFAGVMYSEYQLYGAQEQAAGQMIALNGITSSIANRVSYFFNFHGPSVTINTMCSSSLYAVYLACQSLKNRECEIAVAGGVNLSIHPNKYIMLSQSNFLSSKGKCESFGKDGDGYVPGEGVGSILLKPVSKAIADNDHIYGIIRGSAMNHDGKTNGFTVPNPNAQADLIRRAFEDAKVDPREVSYVEAHGTGTALGDPIEIQALTKAFSKVGEEKQFCAIGSVKSNIGHLESAAGIASITKVLLQMKYGKLVPSIHSQVLNPNINFEETPFRVQHQLEDWKRPMLETEGTLKEKTRIAGISAFGAGGTNVHMLIEEYKEPLEEPQEESSEPRLILLSGKEERALKERAEELLNAIKQGKYQSSDLIRIAYTLQNGREMMEYRYATIVSTLKELEDRLADYLAGIETEDTYTGNNRQSKMILHLFQTDEDLKTATQTWMKKRKYGKLLELWVRGIQIDWKRLYSGKYPKKISLPTYPFAKERIWYSLNKHTTLEPDIRERLEEKIVPEKKEVQRKKMSQIGRGTLQQKTVEMLIEIFSAISSINTARINPEVNMDEYGIDSVMIKEFSVKLNELLGNVPVTLFFEYQSIQSLADYLVKNKKETLCTLFQEEVEEKEQETKPVSIHLDETTGVEAEEEGIAVIGMSGRYPGANNIKEFWQNLKAGKDCIQEIPEERWNIKQYYDKKRGKEGKIYGKWGGFIEDVDKFDPLFFHISPDDAEAMDPQERIFLESVYETLEDAGYTRQSLQKCENLGLGGDVGVFVGVTFMEYQFYGIESQQRGKITAVPGIPSAIANRVSYYCNFHGPSMSVDTMCSSSLTALHLACESIKQGDCEQAVVGGVNLSLHPNKYLFLSKNYFLSTKGRCESFGNDGDGYVPGEGVVSVLLKPLRQAKKDGDHIYGVIKATAVNHGGKTNGYTVPNPTAQRNVIQRAFSRAKVNPRMISYLEAHGTGTSLGDPIEIAGITNAFREVTDDCGFCSVGSVKSNIGHLEAASGLAGLTKILLQMKYKMLVPSIHSETLNENIDFSSTPFYVQHELEEWKCPVIEVNGKKKEENRIAALSSFGAGGANAHVIVEEYVSEEEQNTYHADTRKRPVIILLSAKSREKVREQADRLLTAIQQDFTEEDLKNISYTLQVGREQMEERLCFLADSLDEVKEKLEAYVSGDAKKMYWEGHGREISQELKSTYSAEQLEEKLEMCFADKDDAMLAKLWVAGVKIDWEKWYDGGQKPQRVSLPTYPFEREHCWIPEFKDTNIQYAENQETKADSQESEQAMFLHTVWKEEVWSDSLDKTVETELERKLIFCGLPEQYVSRLPKENCYIISSKAHECSQLYEDYAVELLKLLKETIQQKSSKKVLLQLVLICNNPQEIVLTGLTGMLKSAVKENKKLMYQVIEVIGTKQLDKVFNSVIQGRRFGTGREIKWQDGKVYSKKAERLHLIKTEDAVTIPWKEKGVYLLTGGAGGVGLLFAEEIVKQVKNITLYLTGRSKLNQSQEEKLAKLCSSGVEIHYLQVDIRERAQVEQMVKTVIDTYGYLNGILHAAGVIRDSFLLQKKEEELHQVFGPKVIGVENLDQCTKNVNLDFMVFFSSAVGEFGNEGQADYAAANAYMDRYAEYRNQLAALGKRYGKTVSINWPLWESGGMQVNKELVKFMYEQKGMVLLKGSTGIQALYEALEEKENQVILLTGNLDKIERTIALENGTRAMKQHQESEVSKISPEECKNEIVEKLKELMGEAMRLNVNRIDAEETLDTYGVDSIKMTVLSQKLIEYYENISSTVFFEYNTLSKLADMLIDEYPEESMDWVGVGRTRTQKAAEENKPGTVENKTIKQEKIQSKNKQTLQEPIAVIGASGRFPHAHNIEAFWDTLQRGESVITEIPKDRWSQKGFYNTNKEEAIANGMSISKWGGFLENFQEFDPLFFQISPAEAKRIDPQERVFLEECWKALEDAGYVRKRMPSDLARNTGVFGGITKTGFNLWRSQKGECYQTSFASMVNRVSYFMDFNGPSVPVDTMCSSAVTAIHQACESLRQGTIQMAVAGAVNLYMHPSNYIELSQAGLISDRPDNCVFGKGGIGFTPSEGVGAVVLKRLSDAERDHDNVIAVIRGSAVLHSGRTNGYHVPDPEKQAMVIKEALRMSGVDKTTIRHIEAAANGSEIADAMEMSAITKVFGDARRETNREYTMGSVKALYGHGEAVSGMAQFIKALLELKYRKICPTPLPKELNPKIYFDKLPFRIVTEVEDFEMDRIKENTVPLRIGINSFGAGGVYGHLILEEYKQKNEHNVLQEKNKYQNIFVFSAKTLNALQESVLEWIAYLERNNEIEMDYLAAILQMSREPMKRRVAVIADTKEQLIIALKNYVEEDVKGNLLLNENGLSLEAENYQTAVNWTNGEAVSWDEAYLSKVPRTISMLPLYPFAHRTFWIEREKVDEEEDSFLDMNSILQEQPQQKSHAQEEFIESETIQKIIKDELYDILFLDDTDEFDNQISFMELGVDSIMTGKLIQNLNKKLKLDENATVLFDYPNTEQLACYLAAQVKEKGRQTCIK